MALVGGEDGEPVCRSRSAFVLAAILAARAMPASISATVTAEM